MVDERLTYADEVVQVTNIAVTTHVATYLAHHVTSVALRKVPSNRVAGVVVAGIGVVVLLSGLSSEIKGCMFIFGLILAAIGIAFYSRARDEYAVRIAAASGEHETLRCSDEQHARRVIAAITAVARPARV